MKSLQQQQQHNPALETARRTSSSKNCTRRTPLDTFACNSYLRAFSIQKLLSNFTSSRSPYFVWQLGKTQKTCLLQQSMQKMMEPIVILIQTPHTKCVTFDPSYYGYFQKPIYNKNMYTIRCQSQIPFCYFLREV